MESVAHVLTRAQALTFVRKLRGKGHTLFIAVGQSAPIADKPGYCFPIGGNIEVSHKQAIKFLADAYSQVMADKGALCEIRTLRNCVFIGRGA